MVVYRVDADAAFELLKWRSQETNVKLRILAERHSPRKRGPTRLRGDCWPTSRG